MSGYISQPTQRNSFGGEKTLSHDTIPTPKLKLEISTGDDIECSYVLIRACIGESPQVEGSFFAQRFVSSVHDGVDGLVGGNDSCHRVAVLY